jgi:Na+/H+ antiporter NhaD/arsenite permease-like protein
MVDIAVLFAAIFVTVAPVLAIMRAGPRGALAAIVPLVSSTGADAAYFWLTGGLSSLLDSAPTYLVFFNLAGDSAAALTGPQADTLTAISAGAVFMGAATYVGNAPNLMVKALCEERGVAMPSFIGYMGWAGLVLVPLYLVLTVVFFR